MRCASLSHLTPELLRCVLDACPNVRNNHLCIDEYREYELKHPYVPGISHFLHSFTGETGLTKFSGQMQKLGAFGRGPIRLK